jgi:hypothetical protein
MKSSRLLWPAWKYSLLSGGAELYSVSAGYQMWQVAAESAVLPCHMGING